MDHLKTPTKSSTPIYAVYSNASPNVIYTHSLQEARKHLGTPELRESGGRFQAFQSLEEGEKFFIENPVSKLATPGPITKNEDGYRSPYSKVRPQEHSKFLKLIENKKNHEAVELMNLNPHYFIDMSIDQPSILHNGCRYNALHICARYDNLFIAMEIMKRVKDLQYISNIYQTHANVEETSATLVDKFLNTPDKMSGRSPMMWAARNGFLKLVMFLSSFPEAQLPDEKQVSYIQCHDAGKHTAKCGRIFDSLRHPSQLYCVTLYKEENDADMPFISITSRFPFASVPANQKQLYFKNMPCSFFSGRTSDGNASIRVSKDVGGANVPYIPSSMDGVNSLFVPYASVGVFGQKETAVSFYKIWSAEFKKSQDTITLRDHLSNFAIRLADSQNFFVFFSNLSGMLIPNNKRALYKDKLQFNSDNPLSKSMEKLSICVTFHGIDDSDSDEDEDNNLYFTPPTSPAKNI